MLACSLVLLVWEVAKYVCWLQEHRNKVSVSDDAICILGKKQNKTCIHYINNWCLKSLVIAHVLYVYRIIVLQRFWKNLHKKRILFLNMNSVFSDLKRKNKEWWEKEVKEEQGCLWGGIQPMGHCGTKEIDEYLKQGDFTEGRKEERPEKEFEF